MKGKTLLLSLMAALGGCPLFDAFKPDEPTCRASDLGPGGELDVLADQSLVVTICEVGRTTARDASGHAYTRTWVDRLSCDLRDIADAPRRGVAVQACTRNR